MNHDIVDEKVNRRITLKNEILQRSTTLHKIFFFQNESFRIGQSHCKIVNLNVILNNSDSN